MSAGTKSSATVQQMQPFGSSTMSSSVQPCDAAALDEGAVEAEVAELVDEHGEAPPAGVLEEVAHQGGLAGAEEAGDDRAGDLGERSSFGGRRGRRVRRQGGMRATTPLRKASGRSRQGTMPSAVAA